MSGGAFVLTVHDLSTAPLIEACMGVMERAFDPVYGEAWTADQTRSMLDLPGASLIGGWMEDRMVGFGLIRSIVGESELLLLGVDPAVRRLGLGRMLLERCLSVARGDGARTMFLEVRDGNDAAALYRSARFEQYYSRPDYYLGKDGKRRSALSLKRNIDAR